MTSNIPPHDLNAERAILSCLLQDKTVMDKIYEMLKTDDFYHDKHKIIYETMLELHSKSEPLDAFTVGSHLDTKHQLEVIGGLDYLLSLSSEVPTTANSEYYGKIVEEKATLRALLTAAGSISD